MTPRADAVRSRSRILEAARTHDLRALRLNDVARDAGVGIGTVYRHFPTPRALVEALSLDALERLAEAGRVAAEEPDPGAALRGFLATALRLQLEDAGLEPLLTDMARAEPAVHDACAAARGQIFRGYEAVLVRAQRAGIVRRDLTAGRLHRLVCGIEHAVRLGAPADEALLLDILLAGISTPPTP
ncbi:helix-turn-helix domain-containing protein [Microbacterium sp. ET2]|uniref:TetR/AcrR family transcriptional regulator n=1 Tax=Microbacterium albipurpureum TaxID=3050384 RepID=UPI00259C6D62|nr:TetR/AcrR family transcriptional regulator [Microbacterium sp. ET2 (Ac-2212)]WJL94869.1 helix-turn-helix domain-containing protein [Microbacterium sp. ET2 (Ac-2212)]